MLANAIEERKCVCLRRCGEKQTGKSSIASSERVTLCVTKTIPGLDINLVLTLAVAFCDQVPT